MTAELADDHTAIECVWNWLEDDNHGFRIPATDWVGWGY